MIPFSILDLSPIIAGNTAAQAFHNTLNLAQHAEQLGYNRYWLAEHHNMPGAVQTICHAGKALCYGSRQRYRGLYRCGSVTIIYVGSAAVSVHSARSDSADAAPRR